MDHWPFVPLSRRQILGGAAASLVAQGIGGAADPPLPKNPKP